MSVSEGIILVSTPSKEVDLGAILSLFQCIFDRYSFSLSVLFMKRWLTNYFDKSLSLVDEVVHTGTNHIIKHPVMYWVRGPLNSGQELVRVCTR